MLSAIKKMTKQSNMLRNKINKKVNFSSKLGNDNFANGTSAVYLERMYLAWKQDPKSVHLSWDAYFSNMDKGLGEDSFQAPPTLTGSTKQQSGKRQVHHSDELPLGDLEISGVDTTLHTESNKVVLLVRAFQRVGYLAAKIDPLELESLEYKEAHYKIYSNLPTLDYKTYGFKESDLDKEFIIKTDQISGILSENRPLKLREIIDRLQKAYCSTIGAEFMYCSSRDECNFLREKLEDLWVNYSPSNKEKLQIYDRLAWSVLFEDFLKTKFTTHKRFGLEGLESLISGLKGFVDTSVELGLKDITLGMPHRGRLNVLANVFRKPISKIFAEFQGKHDSHDNISDEEIKARVSGDVKYHLGTHYQRTYPSGKTIHMDILPNPSHLECVNPVVMGKTRAKQHFTNDITRENNIAILIHGDAAFAGQGVVYESMQMSNLESFSTGGVLHVIANNQIGFTTTPKDGRSTPFCTDIGKALEAPIIHVNADDPIAVDFVFKIAAEYSRKFPKDIIIDVVGYRKMGHNELDQPLFTQPMMYHKIAEKENVLASFEKRLIKEGVPEADILSIKNKIKESLEKYYQEAVENKFDSHEWIPEQWESLSVKKYSAPQNTGIPINKLKLIGEKINTMPTGFTPHPQIKKIYDARLSAVKEGKNIDWGTAENLAYGHLLDEGYTVRLTGQDVERGTFSHRHAVIHDQKTGEKYMPLKEVATAPQNVQIHNSHLSEFAVMGFELGFSYYNPDSLVIWEAQFGDFANEAQVIIDQFISSGESKWNVQSGLVLLLPHGMDGQGPEHSSCRIERFLNVMDDDPQDIPDLKKPLSYQIQNTNMQVCNPTTPANFFHLLARQLKRQFRKPLIVPSPKKLLKLKQCVSSFEEFGEGLRYIKVRPESNVEIIKNSKGVKRLLVCQGQVYYELIARREKLKKHVF